jgi:hypothetical protein
MACRPELCLVDPRPGNVGRGSEIEREDGGGGEAVKGEEESAKANRGHGDLDVGSLIVECVRTWLSILWKRDYYEGSAIFLYTYTHTHTHTHTNNVPGTWYQKNA